MLIVSVAAYVAILVGLTGQQASRTINKLALTAIWERDLRQIVVLIDRDGGFSTRRVGDLAQFAARIAKLPYPCCIAGTSRHHAHRRNRAIGVIGVERFVARWI